MRLVTLLVVLGLTVAGCGYKGSLTLPDKPATPSQEQKQDNK